MSKKNEEIQVEMDTIDDISDILESEAYQEPKEKDTAEEMVVKPIGQGGPVPIIAPKKDTIQLQPIVVPLAVVPYMAQDNGSLRSEVTKSKDIQQKEEEDAANEIAIKDQIKQLKKRQKINKRVFSLFAFLFAALAMVPFIVAKFVDEWAIGGSVISMANYDIITQIEFWTKGVPPLNMAYTILGTITFCFSGLGALLSLIGIIFGTFPHVLNIMLPTLSLISMLIMLILSIVWKDFQILSFVFVIVVMALNLIQFILACIFAAVLNKSVDKVEELNLEI